MNIIIIHTLKPQIRITEGGRRIGIWTYNSLMDCDLNLQFLDSEANVLTAGPCPPWKGLYFLLCSRLTYQYHSLSVCTQKQHDPGVSHTVQVTNYQCEGPALFWRQQHHWPTDLAEPSCASPGPLPWWTNTGTDTNILHCCSSKHIYRQTYIDILHCCSGEQM